MTFIKEQGESIKKQKRNNTESGRSMVEMLGVLAIMGVLSVGSIAGYQYAMNKYRANTLINDLSRRAAVVSFLIGRIPVVQASGMRRRSFIEKHRIRYQNDVSVSEDLPIYDTVLAHGGQIMTLPETLYAYRLHRSNPSSYYYQIADIQKSFFEKRWRRLFPDADYPETQCERLRYLQTHNNRMLRQSLLDNMFQTHCRDNRFNPTGAGWFLPLPNGGEWAVVSQNTKRFYSDRLQKYGVLVSGTDSESIIRWDGDQDVTIYRNK